MREAHSFRRKNPVFLTRGKHYSNHSAIWKVLPDLGVLRLDDSIDVPIEIVGGRNDDLRRVPSLFDRVNGFEEVNVLPRSRSR